MTYYPQSFYIPPVTGQIIQVNGKAGAEALQMSPNSSVYVQDSTQGDRIFLCMTDGAGYKTVRGIIGVFEEEQEKQQQETAIASLEARIKALEGKIDEYVVKKTDRNWQRSSTPSLCRRLNT